MGEGGAGTAVLSSFPLLHASEKHTKKKEKNGSRESSSCNLEPRKNQCVLRFHLSLKSHLAESVIREVWCHDTLTGSGEVEMSAPNDRISGKRRAF